MKYRARSSFEASMMDPVVVVDVTHRPDVDPEEANNFTWRIRSCNVCVPIEPPTF